MMAHLRNRALPGLLIAAVFFAVGAWRVHDTGLTFDEPETIGSAKTLFHNLLTQPISRIGDGSLHVIPGYYFVSDTLLGATIHVLDRTAGVDEITATHLYHLAQSSLALLLLYQLVLGISSNRRLACLAALAMALTPQFLAHSQNNPKDLPTLLAFVLAAFATVRAADDGRAAPTLAAAGAWGFAFTTNLTSILLVPILFGWMALVRPRLLLERRGQVLALAVLSGVAALLLFPALWNDPLPFLAMVRDKLASNDRSVAALHAWYLGQLRTVGELPWHSLLVNFLAATPLPFLAAAALAPLAFRGGSSPSPLSSGTRDVATLGLLWCVVPLVADLFLPFRYDGVRHYLFMIPGFCMLVAAGFESVAMGLPAAWSSASTPVSSSASSSASMRRGPSMLVLALPYAWVLVEMVGIHPYQGAYLNQVTNALVSGRAERSFEVEYWGHAYREGARWLNANAEADAEILVPAFKRCAEPFLDRKPTVVPMRTFLDPSRTRYLMVITRYFDGQPFIDQLERTHRPVFAIRRQKGTLLQIFRNDAASRIDGAGPTGQAN